MVFFCLVFDLVQYKNKASGSLGSRREIKESGSSMATKKTRGTAQLLLSKTGCLGLKVTENSIFLHMVIWASESVSGCLVSRVSAWKTINRLEHGSEAPFLEFLSFSLGYLGGFLEPACVLVVCLHSCTFEGVVLLKSLPSLHSTTSISALVF